MNPLPTELRNKLERTIIEARDVAEAGAKAALEAIAVHHHEPFSHMSPEERKLRNHLRARARQLGDKQNRKGELEITHLVRECAYEHWHRMLFARFLAENDLLIEPEMGVSISLEECEELAKEGGKDLWTLASEFAQRMLPQIFRPNDPVLKITFASEHRLKLEKLLNDLEPMIFTASDSLGWVYQFWQSKRKKEVNQSGNKIGADELPAVTQLFTEPYMVEFLLHNTLGAWWAGRKLTADDLRNATSEEELRRKIAFPGVKWEYIRFVRDTSGIWRPAAGTFAGWPEAIRQLKLLDPCCGSGHFLVAALHILVEIHMAEERLSATEAVDAVLRDNLHGLEIDERCCQIAAFALALASWTYPAACGYRALPDLHIACTGIGPQSTDEQWVKLAQQVGMPTRPYDRERIKNGLFNLHELFSQAPTLGSLINPAQISSDIFAVGYEKIQPYLAAILTAEKADEETRERAVAATGMVRAADLLAQKYTLVITNVPYRKRSDHNLILSSFADQHYRDARGDLATMLVSRGLKLLVNGGALAVVTPQNWLFLTTYKQLRKRLLMDHSWCSVIWLGENAFESPDAAGAFAAMEILVATTPSVTHQIAGFDVSAKRGEAPILASQKASMLRGETPFKTKMLSQDGQLDNPDCRVTFEMASDLPLLNKFARSLQGTTSGDNPRFVAVFWEVEQQSGTWSLFQTPCDEGIEFGGCHQVLRWEKGQGELAVSPAARVQGQAAFGRRGVLVRQMSTLPASHYLGEMFDMNGAVIVAEHDANTAAIWTYLCSADFRTEVRRIDPKLNVTNATLAKVPFDFAHWQQVAAKKYPDGLPEPESDDPTQWLFHGWPEESTAPLQVSVARLLGYRWPAELDDNMRISKKARALVKRCNELANFGDKNGIVCISSVRGDGPAAERLMAILAAAGINPTKARELAGGTDLEDWLRNSFFEEHCKLFHDRPFMWHIWDSRKRHGFHALINYHKLVESSGKGRKLLETLTYSYLGEWITRQKEGVKRGEDGAEDRLAAALELQKRLIAIIEGEPPFDIFVRWKTIEEQPIGWEPDINDGVRLNIRPFLAQDIPGGRKGAGILRWKPNINWNKDRGKDVASAPWFQLFRGDRVNDHHLSLEEKRAARAEASGRKGETENG